MVTFTPPGPVDRIALEAVDPNGAHAAAGEAA